VLGILRIQVAFRGEDDALGRWVFEGENGCHVNRPPHTRPRTPTSHRSSY
jgi:hypothetical protein